MKAHQYSVVTKATAESGPLTLWDEEMQLETRQFMAMQAMSEAFYILRQLTVKWMFTNLGTNYIIGTRQMQSLFSPLLDQIDKQLQRDRYPRRGGEKVCEVPLFAEMEKCPNDQHGHRGFRAWWYTIRERKMRFWRTLVEKYPNNLQEDWKAGMYYLTRRIELMTTLTLVCIHKNVRGFPETQWMRRYAAFGGGTLNDEVGGGEFGVENLDDRYKMVVGEDGDGADVQDRVVNADGVRTNAVLTFNAFYGDLGGTGDAYKQTNQSPNAGYGVKVNSKTIYPLRRAVIIGAAWAMTPGWINDNTFVNAMENRKRRDVVFSAETRWRYGAFPFKSHFFTSDSRHAEIVKLLRKRVRGLDTKKLEATLSDGYMNAYKLVYFGTRTELRLPAIQTWYNPKTGVPYEGAFINGPLHNYMAAGGKKKATLKKWGPPTWQDEHAGIDRDQYGLQQPGQMPGAEPDDMSPIPQPHSGELQELQTTPHKGGEDRPGMYVGEIPRQPQFGPATIIIQPAPAPGSGGSLAVGPFSFTGEGAWWLGALLILLLLFFLFR